MTEIQEIRKAKLAAIIGEEKIAAFARRNGLTEQQAEYLRQIMRKKSARPLGAAFARSIETALSMPLGSLDERGEADGQEILNASFARKVAKEASDRDIPTFMQQTVLYILRTAPERTPDK